MSFTKSLANTFLTKGVITFLGIFTGIIKARWLGVEGIGILAILQLVLSMSFRILNFGIGSSLAYYGAKGEITIRESLRLILKMVLLFSLIAIPSLILVKDIPPSPWIEVGRPHYYLMLLCIPLFFVQNFMQRSLTSKLMIKETNFSDTLATLAHLISLVVFVIFLNWQITGAILAVMSSLIISSGYLLKLFLKLKKDEKPEHREISLLRKLLSYGFWNYLIMLVNYVMEQFPLFLLKSISEGFIAVGLYSKAKSLEQKARLVTNPISHLIFPYTAASTAETATNRTNQLTRITFILIILAIGSFSLIIKYVIGIMYGAEFIPASKVFYATLLGIVLWPIGQFHIVHIAASGDAKRIFLKNLYVLLPSIPVMYLLVKYFGMVGAGWCFSLIQVLNFIIRLKIYMTTTNSHLKDIFLLKKSDYLILRKLLTGLIDKAMVKIRKYL